MTCSGLLAAASPLILQVAYRKRTPGFFSKYAIQDRVERVLVVVETSMGTAARQARRQSRGPRPCPGNDHTGIAVYLLLEQRVDFRIYQLFVGVLTRVTDEALHPQDRCFPFSFERIAHQVKQRLPIR